MDELLKCLNALQRCILKHMLLQNAEIEGWNSVHGKRCLAFAHEVKFLSKNDDLFYETTALEFVLKTL